MYKRIVRPVLFLFDPEKVHNSAVLLGRIFSTNFMACKTLSWLFDYENAKLSQKIHNIEFRNPVGLAAGFDKDCHLMKVISCLGFGFEEVGSITAEPYEGNKGKRLKRLPKDKGIIVYYGLKNKGAEAVKKSLNRKFRIPVGISIAKTNKKFDSEEDKLKDWMKSIETLKDCGDYITLNLSCPNTSDETDYCDPAEAEKIFSAIIKSGIKIQKPVFVKVAWSLTHKQCKGLIDVCDKTEFIKGFILTNLHKDRSKLNLKTPEREWKGQPGGVSGPVVKNKALSLVRKFYKLAGDRYTIIGCGGIFTAEDAYDYIKNGASLVQLITGLIYEGPSAVKKINRGLVRLLDEEGYSSITEAVGKSVT